MTQPVPAGFHTLTPHLVVADGAAAIEFYKKAFGAQENTRLLTPDGKTMMHAQLTIGNSVFMLGGEMPPHCLSPKNRGVSSVYLHLYVADADAAFDRVVQAGGIIRMPVFDMFWGDRYGVVEDPSGHQWSIATHQHDYTQEQIEANFKAFMAKMPKC
jgi:PhnB protein